MPDLIDRPGCFTAFVLLVLFFIFFCMLGLFWYRAGVQQSVWERQGVHLTRWEVFMGAKPVIRSLGQPE